MNRLSEPPVAAVVPAIIAVVPAVVPAIIAVVPAVVLAIIAAITAPADAVRHHGCGCHRRGRPAHRAQQPGPTNPASSQHVL